MRYINLRFTYLQYLLTYLLFIQLGVPVFLARDGSRARYMLSPVRLSALSARELLRTESTFLRCIDCVDVAGRSILR